jgi:hypothetical protein
MWKMAVEKAVPTKVVWVGVEMSAVAIPQPAGVLAFPVILVRVELVAAQLVEAQPRHHTDPQTGG